MTDDADRVADDTPGGMTTDLSVVHGRKQIATVRKWHDEQSRLDGFPPDEILIAEQWVSAENNQVVTDPEMVAEFERRLAKRIQELV